LLLVVILSPERERERERERELMAIAKYKRRSIRESRWSPFEALDPCEDYPIG